MQRERDGVCSVCVRERDKKEGKATGERERWKYQEARMVEKHLKS